MGCEPIILLQHSKTPRTPNVQNLSQRLCLGVAVRGGPKFDKICQNVSENCRFSNFKNILTQIPVPLTGTLKNNRSGRFGMLYTGKKGSQPLGNQWPTKHGTDPLQVVPRAWGLIVNRIFLTLQWSFSTRREEESPTSNALKATARVFERSFREPAGHIL